MTGTKSTRERFGAVFFAAIMVTSMVAFGMAGFAGSAAAENAGGVDTTSAETDNIVVGSANQSMTAISITDDASGGSLAARTIVTLPQGITVNESQSSLLVTTNQSGGLAVESTTVENNGRAIRVDHGDSVSQANETLRIRNLVVDAAPSVSNDPDAKTVNINTAEGSGDVTSVIDDVDGPDADVDGGSLSVDSVDQTVTDIEIQLENSSDQIAAGSDIVIQVPQDSGITFNTSRTFINSSSVNIDSSNSSAGTVDANAGSVDSQQITVPVTETISADTNDDGRNVVTFGDVSFDTSPSAVSTNLSASVEAPESTGTIEVNVDDGAGGDALTVDTLELFSGADEGADVPTSGNQAELENDPNGETGVLPVDGEQAITVRSVSNAVPIERSGSNTTVVVSIPDSSGVTFDTSTTPTVTNKTALGATVTPTFADSNTLEFDVGSNDDTDETEAFQVNGIQYNLSAGASGNTTLTATTNISQTVVDSSNVITVNQASVDTIQGDVNNDGLGTGSEEATGLNLDSTTTVTLALNNTTDTGVSDLDNDAIGGGAIDLTVDDTPSDASVSFNDSSPTTGEDGTVDVNVTIGNTTGTYNITAASASNPEQTFGINLTAQAGPVNQFNVTGEQNALVDTTDLSATPNEQTSQAVYQVRLEDASGNLNSTDNSQVVPFSTSVGDSAATVETVADTLNNDGTSAGAFSDGEYNYSEQSGDGVFYVFVSDPTPGDTDLTVQQGASESTGTATFFDTVDSVDVSLNSSTAAVDSDVEVSATPVTSDGTTITVANLSTTTTVNNTTVASPGTQDLETAADGTATATITADQNGTTFVNATISGVTGSTELTVGGTGSPLDGTAGEYDADGDGEITISELANAGSAYTDGELTISELAEVGAAYTSSN